MATDAATEKIDLRALIIHKTPSIQEALTQALRPEIEFLFVDYCSSVRRAVLSHQEESYNVCFVSDQFTEQETEMFFADVVKLGRQNTCLFVQLRDELSPDFDRQQLRERGFATIVSNKATFEDKQALQSVFVELLQESEVERKVRNVDEVMTMLVREIDRVAKDRKRGLQRSFNTISIDYIADEAEFHEDVLMEYFTSLGKTTQQTPEKLYASLAVPESVVSRDLPNLTAGKYTGISRRVWDKLAKKYGVEEPTTPEEKTEVPEGSSPDALAEQPKSKEDAVWEKLKAKYEVS